MSNSLYLVKGKITVQCKGYWYSSGGGKGSFGYFPHLKDANGFPVFPDTQVLGNLKFFMNWSATLLNNNNNKAIIDKYLKRNAGTLLQSKLLATELTLTDDSKKLWSLDRYKILPRISIDEDKKVVKEHFLVSFEASYLEGLTLESDIYLGYIKKKDELEQLQSLIKETFNLMGSIGAFRSRGFGRGKFQISWGKIEEVNYNHKIQDITEYNQHYKIILQNLVNFRNKRFVSGVQQNVSTYPYISSSQFKSWIAKVYNDLFNEWLDIETFDKINVTNIYPSNNTKENFFPAPMTYLKDSNKVVDMFQTNNNSDNEESYLVKPKQLDDTYFVTNKTKPEFFKIKFKRKFRNVIDENNFHTLKEGGLFTQEYIEKNSFFTGKLSFAPSLDKQIISRIIFILKNIKPTLGFSIFSTAIEKLNETQTQAKGYLVVEDLPYYTGSLKFYEKLNDTSDKNIKLSTKYDYSTVLKRLKRPKIVIEKRSVFKNCNEKFNKNFIPFIGFGVDINLPQAALEQNREIKEDSHRESENIELTSAQAGLLRKFKESYIINKEVTERALKELYEKYDKKGYDIPFKIKKEWINELLSLIEDKDKFLEKIEYYLDSYYYKAFSLKFQNSKSEIRKNKEKYLKKQEC